MKNRVTIKITESAKLIVNITEKMVADYKECRLMAEQRDCDGKECRTCSLDTYEHLGIGLCGIPEVVKAIEEKTP